MLQVLTPIFCLQSVEISLKYCCMPEHRGQVEEEAPLLACFNELVSPFSCRIALSTFQIGFQGEVGTNVAALALGEYSAQDIPLVIACGSNDHVVVTQGGGFKAVAAGAAFFSVHIYIMCGL